jgi:hypothetical protein
MLRGARIGKSEPAEIGRAVLALHARVEIEVELLGALGVERQSLVRPDSEMTTKTWSSLRSS